MLNDHIPRSVLGDGNCMYRALSRGLFGTENHHLHVRLLTALEIIQNWKLYDVSGKEFVDLVYDSRVFHNCYDSIGKSTTEPRQDSEMLHIYAASVALSVCVNSYFPPQPRGANFEADTRPRIVNGNINVLGTRMSSQGRIQLFVCVLPYANPWSFVPHNHNLDAIKAATLKATVNERAGVGDVQPARLLAGALLNVSDAAKGRVKMQTVMRGIRRYRQGMVEMLWHHLRRPVDEARHPTL